MPATYYKNATGTVPYDVTKGNPFTPAGFTALFGAWKGGNSTTNTDWPYDNKVYDGVIVRTPGDGLNTNAAGKQIGRPLSNSQGTVKVASITDGTSKTMMIAEKYVRVDAYEASDDDAQFGRPRLVRRLGRRRDADGLLYADQRWRSDRIAAGCVRHTSRTTGRSFPGKAAYNVYHFGSAHTSGINAVYADGSVHAINYDVDPVLFNRLAARNDGEVIDTSSL